MARHDYNLGGQDYTLFFYKFYITRSTRQLLEGITTTEHDKL